MVLCDPIYIKSIPYYYQYYNNYIKKNDNCESDKFIINSLKCKHKFLIPKFITKSDLIKKLESINSRNNKNNNKLTTFIKDIPKTINNNPKCSICFNTCHNRVFLSCYHSFCYKCLTEHINHQKNDVLKHCNNNNPRINSRNNSICINVNKFERIKTINNIKCPICNNCVKSNNIYLLIPPYFLQNSLTTKISNKKFGTKSTYFRNFVNLLHYYSIGDCEYKEFLFKYIGIKTFHILHNIYLDKSPFNIQYNKKYNTFKIIISNSTKWVKTMNTVLNNSNNIDHTTINFIDYKEFISLINNQFILDHDYTSHNEKNNSSLKNKFIFYFTELENVSQTNNIKSIVSQIKKNIKKKIYPSNLISVSFKQIIIKNTIDEKIFKNKIIIHK